MDNSHLVETQSSSASASAKNIQIIPQFDTFDILKSETPITQDIVKDIRIGLNRKQKQTPAKYLYNELGSKLFDSICYLPWYRITSAENLLLATYGETILSRLNQIPSAYLNLLDLGCGNGDKTALVTQTALKNKFNVSVQLVDISKKALQCAQTTLQPLTPSGIQGYLETYEIGLKLASTQWSSRETSLILFLGSNIGNMSPHEAIFFLKKIRSFLRPGDGFLLGVDLIKPEKQLELAYDDPLGVTAAFNKNLLVRLNQELQSNFDLGTFGHRAVWNSDQSRVEMHLVSHGAQKIEIPGAHLSISFEPGETIFTESSYKYKPSQVAELGMMANFRSIGQWIEPDAKYSLTLFTC